MEKENWVAVHDVYRVLGAGDRVTCQWVADDHDFPPVALMLCRRIHVVGWIGVALTAGTAGNSR